jgi:hypothetical protein
MSDITLKNVFDDIENNKIFYQLDNSYCHTNLKKRLTKGRIKDEYIATVYSTSRIENIIECLEEEGSAIVNYEYIIILPLFKSRITLSILL